MGKRVTEAQFNVIKTSQKLGGYTPMIAKTNNLAETTVRKIAEYDTYQQYKEFHAKKYGKVIEKAKNLVSLLDYISDVDDVVNVKMSISNGITKVEVHLVK